jgi:hypothetical protein
MMVVLAWSAFILTLVQFGVALVNLLFRPWLPRLQPEKQPLVSVLIPARNEELTIGAVLGDLSVQPYENLEIVVFDDLSEDKTAEIVRAAAAADPRIRLVKSTGLPEGWTGKNFACHTLGGVAKGEYLLFLDADVRMGGHLIGNLVASAQKWGAGLITIFPQQMMVTMGEKLTVPVMNYILVSLLPLILVRKSPWASLSAANGQCMFFDGNSYRKITPHERVRWQRVEDITIARILKIEGIRVVCLLGDERIRCRMYPGFLEAVSGFSRSVAAFFGNSLAMAFLFWLLTTWGFIPVILKMNLPVVLAYFLIYTVTRIMNSFVSRQSIWTNLILLFPQQLSMGMFIFRAYQQHLKRSFEWKGRKVS